MNAAHAEQEIRFRLAMNAAHAEQAERWHSPQTTRGNHMLVRYDDQTLERIRRESYRVGRDLGGVQAVERGVQEGSPAPIVKRAERRLIYRWAAQLARSLTK
jgi:hypothetical protein